MALDDGHRQFNKVPLGILSPGVVQLAAVALAGSPTLLLIRVGWFCCSRVRSLVGGCWKIPSLFLDEHFGRAHGCRFRGYFHTPDDSRIPSSVSAPVLLRSYSLTRNMVRKPATNAFYRPYSFPIAHISCIFSRVKDVPTHVLVKAKRFSGLSLELLSCFGTARLGKIPFATALHRQKKKKLEGQKENVNQENKIFGDTQLVDE